MPSMWTPVAAALCEQGSCLQEHSSMWNVYVGLKMYLFCSKIRGRSDLTPITRASLLGSDEMRKETWDTLYLAQILNSAKYIKENF